jgi:hypothetical protein
VVVARGGMENNVSIENTNNVGGLFIFLPTVIYLERGKPSWSTILCYPEASIKHHYAALKWTYPESLGSKDIVVSIDLEA